MTIVCRVGITCVDRPELLRSLKSVMRDIPKNWQVDLFSGSPQPGYLDPVKQRWPQISVHHDGQAYDVVQNTVRALRGIKDACAYSLLLQDDIVVCKRFPQHVDWFVRRYRGVGDVFSFYTPYRAVFKAQLAGQKFWRYPANGFYGSLALAWKPWVIDGFLRVLETRPQIHARLPKTFCMDLRFKWFFQYAQIRLLACVPNVVQHIGKYSAVAAARGKTRPLRSCGAFCGENNTPYRR